MKTLKLLKPRLTSLQTLSRPARLFLAATVLHGIFFTAWHLFFNFFILARGFDREFLGLANAAPAAASLLFGLPLGMLSDRIGQKRAMMLGLSVSVLSLGAQALVLDPALILLTGLLGGAGNSLYYVSESPFMAKLSNKENRTMLFSMNFGLMMISGTVGSLFGGYLPLASETLLGISPGSAASYQTVILTSILLTSLALLPLTLIRLQKDEKGENQEDAPKVKLLNILLRPITLQLLLPQIAIGLGAALLVPYLNLFLVEKFSISDQALGTLFGISELITGVGALLGPRITTLLGTRIRAVVLTQAASLAFLLMLGFTPLFWLAAIAFFARGALMNMAVPLYDSFAMDQIPAEGQATVHSVQILGWEFGWTLGPYLSGLVQQAYGFTPLFITTGILYMVATSLIWIFFHKRETPSKRQPALEMTSMQ
jgi:MFS family permease